MPFPAAILPVNPMIIRCSPEGQSSPPDEALEALESLEVLESLYEEGALEPYPSSNQPPPLRTKEVREIWRRVSSDPHFGQAAAESSVIDLSTVNSASQGSQA